uniref:Protein FAM107B n=2 Tax=Clastoptera arizonana TaxID=38151 RepID=A0A1B6D0U9_9HEMI
MEHVSLKISKINFRGVLADTETPSKDREAPTGVRSTPNSPGAFRLNLGCVNGPILLKPIFCTLEKCVSEPDVCNELCSRKFRERQNVNPPGSKSESHICGIEADEKHKFAESDDINKGGGPPGIVLQVDKMKEDAMAESQMTPQPSVISTAHCPEALIMPRKPVNPYLESQDRQNLHRELLFNQKIGKNVLNQKSELQRALEKHKDTQVKKELELQKQECRTPFERVIEERARRLETLEKTNVEEENGNTPEFLQVHAKLRARMEAK